MLWFDLVFFDVMTIGIVLAGILLFVIYNRNIVNATPPIAFTNNHEFYKKGLNN